MNKQEALKAFAYLGAVWFGNSKQHFAFSAYCRLQGWNKLADKWKAEAEEEWDEAEEVLNRLVELGCKPGGLISPVAVCVAKGSPSKVAV